MICDLETTEMINNDTEIKEMINDDGETKEIHSTQYNYCTLTAMLSRSAAERDIYIFVVQKILQNYNFSPGQELSHVYHQEEEGEEEEADPQLQLWNSWEEERPQGEKMGDATPWHSTSVLSHAAVWLVNSSLLDIMYALSLGLVNQFTHISYSFHIWLHYKLVYSEY